VAPTEADHEGDEAVMLQRRGLLAGLGALLAAPAIIRTPGLLMPVRPVLMGMDFGKDEGTIVFFSTPPTESVMFQRWMAQAARDVEWLSGIRFAHVLPLRIGEG
jgi:hypothetical protein